MDTKVQTTLDNLYDTTVAIQEILCAIENHAGEFQKEEWPLVLAKCEAFSSVLKSVENGLFDLYYEHEPAPETEEANIVLLNLKKEN